HVPRLAVVLNRKAPRCPVVHVLERQIELLLEVASGAGAAAAAAASARASARALRLAAHSAEERLEEVREGVFAPEHLVHFLRRHRAIARLAAAGVRVPP